MKRFSTVLIGVAVLAAMTMTAFAATTVVVTPTNTQGWSTADTRPGGTVNFVADASAPGGSGALQLTTDATTAAKAQFLHAANTALADVNELSYYTKQNSALFAGGAPSYQVVVFLTGTAGFSTLVFEPYQNPAQGPVVPTVWQQWDVDAGLFWSTRTVVCPNGTVAGTPGGPATYTLSAIQTLCPNAVVTGFGVNIGTFNPGYDVETDLVNFDGTTYDFELTNEPENRDECKNGGWQNLTDGAGQPFSNQGQCVSYANHNS
jgi:hypothetical protein